MKILLDENLPTSVKTFFESQFVVKTVHDMHWLGKKNGELPGLLILNGFDIFITADKNIQHQQNLEKLDIAVVILDAVNNRPETLHPLIKKAIAKIGSHELQKLNIIS